MNTLLALLIAAVPLKWTVETTKVQPAQFEVVHGESIALEATLQNAGKPLNLAGTAYLYWQTNGMAEAWWVGAATVTSNRLSAVFLPEMDPGASAVTGFIGIPGEIYRAAFQLRFRHGPGAVPNEIEPPVRTIDFSRVVVTNAPWATPDDVADEATARANADTALSAAIQQKANQSSIDTLTERVEELTGGAVTESDVRGIVTEMGSLFGKVQSVNGKTGTVVITASDVGAYTTSQVDSALAGKASTSEVLNIEDVRRAGKYRGKYNPSIDQKWRTNVDAGDIIFMHPNGTQGQYGLVTSAHLAGDDFEIFHTQAIPSSELPTDGFTALVDGTQKQLSNYYTMTQSDANYVPTTRKVNGQPLTSDINIEGMSANAIELKSGALKTHDNATTITASTVGAYTTAQVDNALSGKASAATVEAIGQQVGVIAAHLNAEDAKTVITNYDSVVHMPEASFQVKVDGEWLKVWDEMTRWNWFLGNFETFSNNVAQAIATKGEKEWGWFNSATGDASPDGLLQLAQPRIQICSGAAYQRYATSAGSYWVLESNGMVANINGTTNGFFRVLDEEGNAQFEIVKGDKQTVFASPHSQSIVVMGVTHIKTQYNILNAVSAPKAEFTRSLADINWISEDSASCPFNVNWTDKGNNIWEIEWWPKSTEPMGFMRCGYERGGETYIKNSLPVSMDYIILDGVKYQLGTATISGNTVLTLTRITL